jgi:hypothetical protein
MEKRVDQRNSIFRKTSLDGISSPERLNDYIRVSNPSVWIVLAAVAVLLAAAAVWGCTAEITPEGLRPIDFLLGSAVCG